MELYYYNEHEYHISWIMYHINFPFKPPPQSYQQQRQRTPFSHVLAWQRLCLALMTIMMCRLDGSKTRNQNELEAINLRRNGSPPSSFMPLHPASHSSLRWSFRFSEIKEHACMFGWWLHWIQLRLFEIEKKTFSLLCLWLYDASFTFARDKIKSSIRTFRSSKHSLAKEFLVHDLLYDWMIKREIKWTK